MEAEQQKKLEEEAKMRVAMLCLELLLMVQKSGQAVEVASLSHYLQGFIHPRWCRISEPSTVGGETSTISLPLFLKMMIYFDIFSKWVAQTTHEPQSLDVEMHPQKSWTNGKPENDGFENDSPFPAANYFRFHLINFRGVWETNIVTIIIYVSVLCEMTTRSKAAKQKQRCKKVSPAVNAPGSTRSHGVGKTARKGGEVLFEEAKWPDKRYYYLKRNHVSNHWF